MQSRFKAALAGLALAMSAGLATGAAAEPMGTVMFDRTLDSTHVGWSPQYSVYLPAGYDEGERLYPVIYLLPGGAGQTHRDWFLRGGAAETFDALIASGTVPPFIAVSPDPRRTTDQSFNTYYLNDFDAGGDRYEDMFFEELIPHVEETYRVVGEPHFRSVIGLSMGGFAALAYVLRHPDTFAAAAALSPAIRTDDQILAMNQAGWDRRYGKIWGNGLEGEDRLSEKYRAENVFHMIETAEPGQIGELELYIDTGADDIFFDGSVVLHQLLHSEGRTERTMASDHRFMIREGGHDWLYWRTGLPEAVVFVSDVMAE